MLIGSLCSGYGGSCVLRHGHLTGRCRRIESTQTICYVTPAEQGKPISFLERGRKPQGGRWRCG
jgi:hypothetical protein